MRTFITLIAREIAERRLLLLASVFLGVVPIVLPWMPGIPARFTPEEIRTAVSMTLAFLFGLAALVMLGSTIVARDLAENRLGFYFSRPISPWVLWGARMAAAGALVVACILLIVAPAAFVDAGSWLEGLADLDRGRVWPMLTPSEVQQQHALYTYYADRGGFPATPASPAPAAQLLQKLGVILLLLALIHAVSSVVRGRNVWLLADLAGLAIVSGLGWTAREALLAEQALGALVWAEWLLVPGVLATLLLAGGVQLASGRTDLLRSHRCLSTTLWPALIVIALAFLGYSRWVASSGLEDLYDLSYVAASPDEEWLVVGGPVRGTAGAEAAFLLHARTDRSWRLGNPAVARVWLEFSADGGTAAWPRCERFVPPSCDVWVKDLRDPSRPPRATQISIDYPATRRFERPLHLRLALSADGTRLALAEIRRLSVYELSSGRLLAAVAAKRPKELAFLSRDEIRFYETIGLEDGRQDRIRTFDLRTRELTETGRLPHGHGALRSPSGEVVFQRRYASLEAGLYDGETGRALLELDEVWTPESEYRRFLADGRFVLGLHRRGAPEILVFSPAGEMEHRIERPGLKSRHFGGELSPGRLLLALREDPRPPAPAAPVEAIPGWATWVLDADTGELSPLAAGVVPLGAPSVPQRLFLGGRKTVVRWDPQTGELRTILPPFDVPAGAELRTLSGYSP